MTRSITGVCRRVAPAVLAAAGVAGGVLPAAAQPAPRAAAAPSARVLVVPFENGRAEPRFQWLSEAAAVLLTDNLRSGGSNAIVRPERVRAFEQLYLPVSATLSKATIIKV